MSVSILFEVIKVTRVIPLHLLSPSVKKHIDASMQHVFSSPVCDKLENVCVLLEVWTMTVEIHCGTNRNMYATVTATEEQQRRRVLSR